MESYPIRVLQYIGSLNVGGSQSMIMEIYRKIDKSKIQFDFIIDRKNENFYEAEIIKLGGKVYKFNNYLNGINLNSFKKEWNIFLKEHSEYKIIHCHVRSVASIVLKIAKKNGLKTICHSHSTSNGKGVKALGKRILQMRIPRYSDYMFACSKESAIWLYGKEYYENRKCTIINNAIDSQKYIFNEKIRKKKRKELGLENKIVLGQVGRIEKVKNQEFSLYLLKELIKDNKDYFLLMIGNGSMKSFINEKIKELNLEHNTIILENRKDVNELMQAMDIYIMPSLWEGLPISLIEAQATDLPCLISKNISAGIIDCKRVKQLEISDNYKEWINAVKNISICERKDRSNLIKENNFDICANINRIENIYQNLWEEKDVYNKTR